MEFESILSSLDTNESGLIDYNEFLAATLDRNVYTKEEYLLAAFRAIDVNGDGFISREELNSLVRSDPLLRQEEEVYSRIIGEVDCNGDGVIDFMEFIGAVIK
jgi:calcium-dependent protein kinase